MKQTLLILACLARMGLAQDSMSINDAVKRALEKNPSIEASSDAEKTAQARVEEAHSGYLPKVNYAESWMRSDNPVFVFSSLLEQHQFGVQNFEIGPLNRPGSMNDFQSLVTADQPIYDAGKTKLAVKSAELGKSMSGEDTRGTRMRVISGAARAYYGAQLMQEELKAAREGIRSAEADLGRAQARLGSGMATESDVLSIKVHVAGVREREIKAEADLDVAKAALNDALGLPLDTPHTLTTALAPLTVPAMPLGEYEHSGIANRPDAKATKLATELARTQTAEARSNWLPQVGFHAAFEADRQRFYDRGGANWLVSLGLRWNVFNGFADKAKAEESQYALHRSEAIERQADSTIRLEVRRAYADLRAASERIEAAKASVAEAEESLRISQNRYEAGLSTVTDLLQVEVALLDSRTRYAAAVHDERVAAMTLEMAAGTLSADSEVLK